MSKNLFRKGLVVAALTGLAATSIAGTPAFADNVNLAATSGTSYSTFVDQTFHLAASFGSGVVPASYDQLKFQVTTDGVATIQAGTDADATKATAITTADSRLASLTVNSSNVAYVGFTAGDATALTNNVIALKVASATPTTATTSVKVVAFVDANNSGAYEAASDTWAGTQTVTFKKYSEVSATPVLTAPFQGDTTVAAKVSFVGLNNEQLTTGSVTADVRVNGTPVTAATATASTDHDYFKLSTTQAVSAADLIYVKAFYNGVAVGTEVTATAGTRKVATIDARLVSSADANGTAVRTDKPFVVKAVLTDADAAKLAGLAVTATVTVQNAALAALDTADTTKQITIAGTTYTDAAKLPGGSVTDAVALTSDANGAVTLAISTHNFSATNGDTITVVFKSQNLSSNTLVVAETAATYSVYTTTGNAGQFPTVDGTAVSIPVKVVDQYGAAIADGYDVIAHLTGSTQTTAATADSDKYTAVVGGVATLSITDNGTGAGTNTYSLSVQKRAANGTYGNSVANGTVYVLVNATALPVAGTIDVTAGTTNSTTKVREIAGPVALNLNDYVAVDTRFETTTQPTVLGGQSIAGTVSTKATASTAATLVKGQKVTVSGKGLQFKTVTDTKNVWTTDSAVAYTDASGAFNVTAYSNLAGKQTITLTAGDVSQVVTVVFAQAAATTGKTLTIDAPATATPGSTVKVSSLLVDKYGNPVAATANFKLSAAGVGVIGTPVTSADADGAAVLYITLGSGDAGTITVTATFNNTGADADKVTKTASVVVAAPKAAAAAKTALAVGADQAQVGAAVDVIATATDAAGKAVAGVVVTFDNVGQGYLSATSATTDASGVAKVKLVGNVAGRNTLTATANGATAANAGVSYGAADANITVKGKRATVTYEYAGLAKVVVSVNGTRKPAVYPADDNEGTYSFNLKAGTNKIVVSIAGKTVDSKTVKIKK